MVKKRKGLKRLSVVLLILVAVLGCLLAARPYLLVHQQKSAMFTLIQMIEDRNNEMPIPDIPSTDSVS